MDALQKAFKAGLAMKEEYATALRGHKAAVDALKCPQREAAEVYYRNVEKSCQSWTLVQAGRIDEK